MATNWDFLKSLGITPTQNVTYDEAFNPVYTNGWQLPWDQLNALGLNSKYNAIEEVAPNQLRVRLQQPGAHKYDTMDAFYQYDPATGQATLMGDPTMTRQTSGASEGWDTVNNMVDSMGKFALAAGAMYGGASLAAGGAGAGAGAGAAGGADAATTAAWANGAGLGGDTLSAMGLGGAGQGAAGTGLLGSIGAGSSSVGSLSTMGLETAPTLGTVPSVAGPIPAAGGISAGTAASGASAIGSGGGGAVDPYGPGSGYGQDTLSAMGATNDTAPGLMDVLRGLVGTGGSIPWQNILGAYLGYKSSGDQTQTASRDPWSGAQPLLLGLLGQGANLAQQYQTNPFSATQRSAYNNLGGLLNGINSNVGGLLANASANSSGANNYDRNNPRKQLIGGQMTQGTWSPEMLNFFPKGQ